MRKVKNVICELLCYAALVAPAAGGASVAAGTFVPAFKNKDIVIESNSKIEALINEVKTSDEFISAQRAHIEEVNQTADLTTPEGIEDYTTKIAYINSEYYLDKFMQDYAQAIYAELEELKQYSSKADLERILETASGGMAVMMGALGEIFVLEKAGDILKKAKKHRSGNDSSGKMYGEERCGAYLPNDQ